MDTLKPERIDYLERLVAGVLDMIKENGIEYIDGEECLKATWLDADLLCYVIKEEVLPVLKRTSEWVSVNTALPNEGQTVLAIRDLGEKVIIETATWDKWWKMNNYIHWMPLPQPPKGD